MAQQIVVTVRKGTVTSVRADGEVEVVIVDYDAMQDGEGAPTLPDGLEYDSDHDIEITGGTWVDAAL